MRPAHPAWFLVMLGLLACLPDAARASPPPRIMPAARFSSALRGGGTRSTDGQYGATWGRARYGFLGWALRFEGNVSDRWQISLGTEWIHGHRLELDQPSYEDFGEAAEAFSQPTVSFGFAARARTFMLDFNSFGGFMNIMNDGEVQRSSRGGVGVAMAFGRRDRVAALVQAGYFGFDTVISDYYLLGVLHESQRYGVRFGCGGGASIAPTLARERGDVIWARRSDGPFRVGFGLGCAAEARFAVHPKLEFDLRLRFGQQDPVASVGIALPVGGPARPIPERLRRRRGA